MTLSIIGSTEEIRDVLCGPQQHNEHCKGWRWEMYMQDMRLRAAAVREETLKIIARARACEPVSYLDAAE